MSVRLSNMSDLIFFWKLDMLLEATKNVDYW